MSNRGNVLVAALALTGIVSSPVLYWVSSSPRSCQDPPPSTDCSGVWDYDTQDFSCNGFCPGTTSCEEVRNHWPNGDIDYRCACPGVQAICHLFVKVDAAGGVVTHWCLNYVACPVPPDCHVHYNPATNDEYCVCSDFP